MEPGYTPGRRNCWYLAIIKPWDIKGTLLGDKELLEFSHQGTLLGDKELLEFSHY